MDLNSLGKEEGRDVITGCMQNASETPADLEERRERMVGGKGEGCKDALLRRHTEQGEGGAEERSVLTWVCFQDCLLDLHCCVYSVFPVHFM